MVQFDETVSLADNTPTNLLALAIANGYLGFQLNPTANSLTLDAPTGTSLFHGNSASITAAAPPCREIAAGDHYTFPKTVDLSQIWLIQSSGGPANVGISFTGLGEHN